MRSNDWHQLNLELKRRGHGEREAGAFLLGPPNRRRRVTRVLYFDDLDPNALQGHIHIRGLAFSRLWDLCSTEGLKVLADVHTHAGTFVRQSSIDADNPMIARVGHIALIFPHLATTPSRPADIGVHRYLGDDGWDSWTGADAARRVKVRRW